MVSIVTGGAGFIGSHLVDALVERGEEVIVIDSLLTGQRENLDQAISSGSVSLVIADLLERGWETECTQADRVYHLSADPDVRQGSLTPDSQFRNNIEATYRLLEAMRLSRPREIVFTSTSTVYGEARTIPTPEDYTPLYPISVYGAGKLACEALISAYAHSFGIRAWIFRFANIIGPRSGHGVITDFIGKLRNDEKELEILGDGRQVKSYLGVDDCIRAMLHAVSNSHDVINTYNIGSEDWIDVKSIADIIVEEMDLDRVLYRYTGGDRGWVGDVPRMQLSIEALKAIGWHPVRGSKDSIRWAARSALSSSKG